MNKYTPMKMHRSHKQHSSSFTKFVARLQHTFASKNSKSSTVISRQPPSRPPTFSSRFQLSEILYDPSRRIEYVSEIKIDSESSSSLNSTNVTQEDQLNISQMNISYNDHSTEKLLQLPNSFDSVRLHSTAIDDLSSF